MADKKISQLTDGTSFQAGDEAVVNRGGVNYKVDPTQFAELDVKGGDVSFYEDTGTTPKFFWDASTERLGIGTTSPVNNLHVNLGSIGGGVTLESNTGINIDFRYRVAGVNKYNVGYLAADNALTWYDNTANAERMRIDSSGNLLVGTTTSPSDTGTIVADGIYLGGTGAANKLEDYEEGTWTPTLTTSIVDFTSVTYNTSNTQGRYTKIGRLVVIQGRISTTAVTIGAASGTVRVGGLPFTPSGDVGFALSVGVVGFSAGWSGDVPSTVTAPAGTTALNLAYRASANGNPADLLVSDVSTSTNDIRFFIAYYI